MTSSTGHPAHHPRQAPASQQTRDTVAWIVVTVILLGVIIAAVGLMALEIAVICVGAGVVAVGLVLAVVLPRLGLSRPVSFAENVPTRTNGPRATDDGRPAPPIDTDPEDSGFDPDRPRPPDLSPYVTFEEAPASELPQTPDVDRAKPQHVNLAPDERIRRIGGEDVIEVPDEQPPERRAGG